MKFVECQCFQTDEFLKNKTMWTYILYIRLYNRKYIIYFWNINIWRFKWQTFSIMIESGEKFWSTRHFKRGFFLKSFSSSTIYKHIYINLIQPVYIQRVWRTYYTLTSLASNTSTGGLIWSPDNLIVYDLARPNVFTTKVQGLCARPDALVCLFVVGRLKFKKNLFIQTFFL